MIPSLPPSLPIERINGRYPSLVFGLSWDVGATGEVEYVKKLRQQRFDTPATTVAEAREFETAKTAIGLDDVAPEVAAAFLGQPEDFIDLNAIIVAVRDDGSAFQIDGTKTFALDGALASTGDDKQGSSGGDDEQCVIQLATMPAGILALALVVQSANGQSLTRAEKAQCHLFYARENREIVSTDLAKAGSTTLYLFGVIKRVGEEFVYVPADVACEGNDVSVIQDVMRKFI